MNIWLTSLLTRTVDKKIVILQVRIPSADCIMIPGLGQQHENDIEAAPVEDIKESITIILQMMKLKSPDDIDIVSILSRHCFFMFEYSCMTFVWLMQLKHV